MQTKNATLVAIKKEIYQQVIHRSVVSHDLLVTLDRILRCEL